ncbi:universal stress protein [Streptomyces endophyticus]|uniref:Universal stress protein n=1 Tax=Streptomyces endophyticus TaxID=714166 RepID=A0ABU6FE55_9ACTN|nr:universal stress protein [Streptomyces endophyticus]MEB8342254.1 universal stress protein [Streptomyces endophyticus]
MDGERVGGRVVVGVGGSPASLAALRSAVAEARRSDRPLVAVLAWEPPEGEAMYRRWPDAAWARHWYEEARARLAAAFEEALGGLPPDLGPVWSSPACPDCPGTHARGVVVGLRRSASTPSSALRSHAPGQSGPRFARRQENSIQDLDVTLRAVRSRPGPALVELAARPDDLLVIGVRPRSLRRAAHRHVRRHAVCPVLTVPVRPLQRAELRALRRVRAVDFEMTR